MLLSIPRPEDFDVSERHGFLPDELPLQRLPYEYYQPWESIITNLQPLILSRRLRQTVSSLPVLSCDRLQSEAEWRRAYTILAFISHSYVWGGDRPLDTVPPSVSVPFLQTCVHLELPPVATYAAVVLWNFRPVFLDEPIDSLENVATLQTFTGSLDESWFYLVSVAIEARGAPIIPMMLDAVAAVRRGDRSTVIACLQSFAERLDNLSALLVRMYEQCDPHVFYHRIRPFLAGSKNMAEAGLPKGVLFDDGTGTQDYVQHAGGSNAQSSLIQFFDVVLGIDHRPTGQRGASTSATAPSHNFIDEMRKYMPGPHRRFLAHVGQVANIRDYVESRRQDKALTTAYDACLAMLRDFRDKHIQMVSRYIIVKSRESASASANEAPAPTPVKVNLASAKSRKPRGTGGTALIPFLKQARDETGDPSIGSWARRIMSNGPAISSKDPKRVNLGFVDEHANGKVEIVGLAGVWSVDDSEGGICHW